MIDSQNIKTPPRRWEALVALLTPRSMRQEVLEELREEYATSTKKVGYRELSAKALSRIIPGRAVTAFNVALVTAQAGALCASFAGAPISFALGFGLSLGLAVLVLRDGHTYPSETPVEAVVDALLAVAFVIASQWLIAVMARGEFLPPHIIVRGSMSSVFALSLLRMIFRRPAGTKKYGLREVAEGSYRMACLLNVTWAIAWGALIITNTDTPGSALDLLFGSVPGVIVAMSYRQRQQGLSRPQKNDAPSLMSDKRELNELLRKLSMLWLPAGSLDEALFFAVVIIQFLAGVFTAPAAVDWLRPGTNFTAALMLFMVWRYIRKVNRTVGRLIQAEIDKLKAAEAR